MVFDAPHRVKTQLVGKGDLFKVFLVDAALCHALAPRVFALPGLRHIEFVKQPEVHPVIPFAKN